MSYNYRIGHGRGRKNLVAAHPQRLESADGQRWACGRNQKRSLGDRRYDSVEVWSLRTRDNNTGKVIEVARSMDRKAAEDWVSPDGIEALKRWVRNGL